MRMSAAVTPLFPYDIEEILAALPDETDSLWDVFRARQRRSRTHVNTRSIAFKWTDLWSTDPLPKVFTLIYPPEPLTRAVMRCVEKLEAHYRGRAVTVLLTELKGGTDIPKHRDGGPILERSHRCHLPVTTSTAVQFAVGDGTFHFAAGQVYEIDNMRSHAVRNLGKTRRIHLICNIMPGAGQGAVVA